MIDGRTHRKGHDFEAHEILLGGIVPKFSMRRLHKRRKRSEKLFHTQ